VECIAEIGVHAFTQGGPARVIVDYDLEVAIVQRMQRGVFELEEAVVIRRVDIGRPAPRIPIVAHLNTPRVLRRLVPESDTTFERGRRHVERAAVCACDKAYASGNDALHKNVKAGAQPSRWARIRGATSVACISARLCSPPLTMRSSAFGSRRSRRSPTATGLIGS